MNCLLCVLLFNGGIGVHHYVCISCIHECVSNETSQQLACLTQKIDCLSGRKPVVKKMTIDDDDDVK